MSLTHFIRVMSSKANDIAAFYLDPPLHHLASPLPRRQPWTGPATSLTTGLPFAAVRSSDFSSGNLARTISLHKGVKAGSVALVRTLLANGADVNARDDCFSTPLHLATHNLAEDMLQLLLSHGANVDAQDCSGRTPLMCATSHWSPSDQGLRVVRLLLRASLGFNLDLSDIRQQTALHNAIIGGKKRRLSHLVIGCLLDAGCSVKLANCNGLTPFQLLLIRGMLTQEVEDGSLAPVYEKFLRNGADVSQKFSIPPFDSPPCSPFQTFLHGFFSTPGIMSRSFLDGIKGSTWRQVILLWIEQGADPMIPVRVFGLRQDPFALMCFRNFELGARANRQSEQIIFRLFDLAFLTAVARHIRSDHLANAANGSDGLLHEAASCYLNSIRRAESYCVQRKLHKILCDLLKYGVEIDQLDGRSFTILYRLVLFACTRGWSADLHDCVMLVMDQEADPLIMGAQDWCSLTIAAKCTTTPMMVLRKMVATDLALRKRTCFSNAHSRHQWTSFRVFNWKTWEVILQLPNMAEKLEMLRERRALDNNWDRLWMAAEEVLQGKDNVHLVF
jgi:hypothetical protein